MNEQTFLKELSNRLSSLSEEERTQVTAFYKEMIADGTESGKTEEQLIAGFGELDTIAAQILAESKQYASQPKSERAVPIQNEDNLYEAREPVEQIIVNTHNVRVDIVSVPDGLVRVRYNAYEADRIDCTEQNGVFTFSQNMQFFLFHWKDIFAGPRRLILEIPESYTGSASVTASNAKLTCTSIKGANTLTLSTGNSPLIAENITCTNFTARTSNAGLRAQNIAAVSGELRTSNAKLSLSRCGFADSVRLQTSNAPIAADVLVCDNIELISCNARIHAVIVGDMRDYAVRSRTSNAANNLPPKLIYPEQTKCLNVRTSNGKIDVNFIAEPEDYIG